MKLKTILHILLTTFLVIAVTSCQGNDSEYTTPSASKDAQIYSFSLSARPVTGSDTINYLRLDSTKFAINQLTREIYNPDSLPFGTNIRRFAPSISLNPASSTKIVQVLYTRLDSVFTLTDASTDSIDFREKLELHVTAEDGVTRREYKVDLRVHKVDPNLIGWKALANLPSNTAQKTVLKANTFYSYSISAGVVVLHTLDKTNILLTWSAAQATSGLSSALVLESICIYNNTFYAIDNVGDSYSSTNGINWTKTIQTKDIKAIIGIIPAPLEANDSLLVIVNDAGFNYFAKTKDLITLIQDKSAVVNDEFPVTGFSSATRYDRKIRDRNMLLVTGGIGIDGLLKRSTWLLFAKDGKVEAAKTTNIPQFAAKAGIPTCLYNDKYYAIKNKILYTSDWGSAWAVALKQEYLGLAASNVDVGQSMIVDEANYIWLFGGTTAANLPVKEVWRGRLNKLNK